jgi:uncharacterized phage protein (TIGR01671 family)
MAREIKFRVWDSAKRQMVNGRDLYVMGDGEVAIVSRPPGNHAAMQYTGLKDKNGREVYEGDIVRFKAWRSKRHGAVKWSGGGCSYVIEMSPTSNTGFFHDPMRGYEVIGNIYESSELLREAA